MAPANNTSASVGSLLALKASVDLSPEQKKAGYYVEFYYGSGKTPIAKGDKFTELNITTKRPGTGISAMRWDEVIGKTAIQDFNKDDLIHFESQKKWRHLIYQGLIEKNS